MALKLIIEENFQDIETLVEETVDHVKSYYIVGPFLQGNLKNKNGRRYPTHILEREVNRYRRDFIEQNRGLGELGHPQGPTINLDRASHKFISLEKQGDNFIGKAKILIEQPHGKMAAGFINENVKLGVSSRGMGSVRHFGDSDEVQEDYFLATPGDIVHDPSAPGAFVNGIMEGKEWVWNNGILVESVIAGYKKNIKNAPSTRLEEARISVFNDFMDKISKS